MVFFSLHCCSHAKSLEGCTFSGFLFVHSCFSVFRLLSCIITTFSTYLELSVFPYVDMGPWQYAECTSLLVQSDSDLLTYTQWQDQNRPVHTFHKPDGSFECVFVFAWDKSVSIHTYLPSHTYEIHQ